MKKQHNNLNDQELLKKIEDLIDNQKNNQKFTNSFLGFCSRLFSVKPDANTDFRLSLKRELLKKHYANIDFEKEVEFRGINKFKIFKFKNKLLNINNLIIMNKKSILIGMPALVLAIVAIMVFQPFGPSIGKLVSGKNFIAQAKALYERNLENSILHQTTKTKDGKDLKAYAKAKGVSIKEAREEWSWEEELEEYWMDSKHDLSKYGNQYDLFITNKDGKEEMYSNFDYESTIDDEFTDNTQFIDMSDMTDEEIEKEMEEYAINYSDDEIESIDTIEGDAVEFETDIEDIDSLESYLKFMEKLAKVGEVDAHEYKENGNTLIAFEEKMYINYGDESSNEMKGIENIYSRLVFNKETSEMVKEVTIVELNGTKYEVAETEIKTEWLNPEENLDIFNPEKYGLKKVESINQSYDQDDELNFEEYKSESIDEIKTVYNVIKKDLSADTQKEIEKLMATLPSIDNEDKFEEVTDKMYLLAESQLDKYYDAL